MCKISFNKRRFLFPRISFLLILFLFSFPSFGQALRLISGVIKDEKGEPLIGVTIKVEGKSAGVASDLNGKFQLQVSEDAILLVSYLDYVTQKIPITNKTTFNISLKPDANKLLSEVVIVGYGKQKAVTVTGAVSSVGGKELAQNSVSSITSALVGRAPGISAVQAGGEPGQNAATIRIRGIATLNGSDPLIVIDGIQQPAEQPYVILNSLDANEIENISVLKDASSTAVYGIRGANGVIVVTTKRGKTGTPRLSATSNFGLTKVTSALQTLNSYDYATMRNMAIRNEQSYGNQAFNNSLFSDDDLYKFQNNRDYTPAEIEAMSQLTAEQKAALAQSQAVYYTSTNWYEQQFGRTAPQQQYNVNATGGTDKIKYFTSIGYFSQAGILSNTSYGGSNSNSDYNRYNFRSNFDVNATKNTTITVNLSGQSSQSVGAITGNNETDLGTRYKALSLNILEGNPFMGPGILDGRLITGFINNGTFGQKGGSGNSPISTLLSSPILSSTTTTLTGNVILKHTLNYLTKGLTVHGSFSYDNSYTKGVLRRNTIPTYSVQRNPSDPTQLIFSGGALNATTVNDNFGNRNWRKIYAEAGINYDRTFGNHTFGAVVLGNAQRYTMPGDIFNTASGLMGLVTRATYNYAERYLLEFNMGYNGTEQFDEGKRFGYFPAYSAGWVISKEPYFPKNNIFSYFKVRGSYGEVGNDQVNGRRYIYLPSTWNYSTGANQAVNGYWFGSSNGSSTNPFYFGALESSIGNPNITWERAKKSNFALETKFLSDRLSLTFDAFKEDRDKILINLGTIPGVYGVAASSVPPANLGKMSNKGYEVQLGWSDKINSLSYSFKGNLSYSKNKVVYKDEPAYAYSWMNTTGFALGQYKGLKSDGFYNTQEELNNRPYNSFDNNIHLGDIRFVDINGDSRIDDKDVVPIGYSNLPRYAFNLNINLGYKGFDVNALFIGTAQGSFPLRHVLQTPFFKNHGNALQYMYDGMWTAEKAASGAEISYPRATINQSSANNNFLFSDFWLKSNDFRRLKNLEIGYTFKGQKFLRKVHMSSLRVYSNANNLFTWGSDLPEGVDPELQDIGANSSGFIYPITRVYNFGLSVQF